MGNVPWPTGNPTFDAAVAAAESVRQGSVASAFATFQAAAFAPSAFAAYKSAVVAADVAYFAAIQAAYVATLPGGAVPINPATASVGIPNELTSQNTSTVTSQV